MSNQGSDNRYKRVEGKITDELLVKKFLNTKKSAKSRNIPFDMSLKRIKQLLRTKLCAITGKRIYLYDEPPEGVKHVVQPDCLSFDRFDSSKGYTDDNVVAVSHEINLKKGNLSMEDIMNLNKGVIKVQKRLAKRKCQKQENM